MYCTKCGTKLAEEAQFCNNCGAGTGRKPENPEGGKKTEAMWSAQAGGNTEGTQAQPVRPDDSPGVAQAQPVRPDDIPGVAQAQPGWPDDIPGMAQPGWADYRPDTVPEETTGKPGRRMVTALVIAILLALAGTGAVVYQNRDVLFGSGVSQEAGDGEDEKDTQKEEDGAEKEAAGPEAEDAAGTEAVAEDADGAAREDASEQADSSDPAFGVRFADNELADTIANLNQGGTDLLSIDVFAENYQPGERNIHYSWDRSLFYALEDVDPASGTDGQINGYDISRKVLRNAQTGNKMEYEIYTNPLTGKVNKIVSIEYKDFNLEITDYYYDDRGRVSFIFVRDDVNYVPSYAVPTKDGERYYYNSDCMVKWRVVSGGTQTNAVIGPEEAEENQTGTEILYSRWDSASQQVYDATEIKMLNAAYNTYNIVLEAQSLTEITGYVRNAGDMPVNGAAVTLYDGEDALYQEATDPEGYYGIVVPSDGRSYRLQIMEEGCVPVNLYEISVNDALLSDFQETAYLVEETDADYDVRVELFDALNYTADGQGLERLSHAAIYIREGMNHREGGVVAQATADAGGQVQFSLKPGMYTAEIVKSGYDTAYYNFAVRQDQEAFQFNASPTLASGEVRIVLTWGEYPSDLDSHLFTPYDEAFGDTSYHIWYGKQRDAVGNNLDVDDTTSYGPETMTIPVLKDGLYKYYVADFTNCSGNNPTSWQMSQSGATVHVYTGNGLSGTFHVPANLPGVIWEVFEIRNGAIVPIQRYYSNIDDKTWWHNDK